MTGERRPDSVLFNVEALAVTEPQEAANQAPDSGVIDLRAVLGRDRHVAGPLVRPGGDLFGVYSASRSPTPQPPPRAWSRAWTIALCVVTVATLGLVAALAF